jgi:uncharacterized membrane protein YeaQ/YmgE (transglycosylase-associated protein family)
MQSIYIIAAFFAGYLLPEFIKMLAPRNYNVPFLMNIMCGFIASVILHYILTH